MAFSAFPSARRAALKLPRLTVVGTVLALSAGLVACDSSSGTTTATTATGTYILTVDYSGVSGPQDVNLTDSAGKVRTFKMQSGAGISDLKGIYTVAMPATGGHKASDPQTVDLTSASQTVTFKF